MRIFAAMVLLCLASLGAEAKQSPYPVTPFEGDKYSARQAQMGADVAKAVQIKRRRAGRHLGPRRGPNGGQRWRHVPIPAPRQVPIFAPLGVLDGVKREAIEAVPLRMLAGVVAPLASKAREIVAACGSKVISGVRHTYVAGTGGRLSLHASGRAVDIKGSPACIYSHLHGWPGGYSTDYARPNIQHVHISYAPRGPEWGKRFVHFVSARRHRYHRHHRRA